MKHFFFVLLCLLVLTVSPALAQSDDNSSSSRRQAEILQAINVTVGGDFVVTGSFTASRMQRLDHFITTLSIEAQGRALGSLTQLEIIKLVQKELKQYALRDITLRRAGGNENKIDLLKFRMTGDFKYNPYLLNDDVIIFPSYDPEKTYIDIVGAVNKPLKFQFVEGDRLSDAILFAGGLNTSYDSISRAVISRLDNTGMKEELITVDIKADATLKCGDRIRILSNENHRKNYKVNILGEIRYPGYIYVARDGSTLSEVIAKAGGFTENADLRNAEVIRDYTSNEMMLKNLLSKEYYQMDDLFRGAETIWKTLQEKKTLEIMRLVNLDEEDSLFFSVDNQLRVFKAGDLVDFTKLDDSSSAESKFLVREGDLIVVPQKFDYVYVFGGSARAGYVKYEPGKDYKYYLQQAGGISETGLGSSNTIIIKGKTMNWITEEKEGQIIEPGDYIYVPKHVPKSTWSYVQRAGIIFQLLGSAATIILLLLQFNK